MRLPKLFIWHIGHALPDGGVVLLVHPVRAKIFGEKLVHLASHPGGHMNAVGDGANGHLANCPRWPNRLPHLPRHFPVQLAHAVGLPGKTQRQHRHVERHAPFFFVSAQPQQLLPADAHLIPKAGKVLLNQMEAKGIVTSRNRGMGGEHRLLLHLRFGFFKRHALRHLFADTFQQQKGGVAFIHVVGIGVVAHCPQHANAAQAKQNLLPNPHFGVARIKPSR